MTTDKTRYGAYEADWDVLSTLCGLQEDLVPTVSNPELPISQASNMKQVGKTPSVLNRHGEVVGFSNWTQYVADEGDINTWRDNEHYGICVQTRTLRALDIDVESHAEVIEIRTFIENFLDNKKLAVRWRGNSGRVLIPFMVTEMPEDQDLYKRTVKTESGMIEFLATGQQFVAYGTHPSGVRYDWSHGGEFPSVPLHVFEELWKRLCQRFGIAEPSAATSRKRGQVLAGVTDRIVEQLEDAEVVLGYGRDGQAHITCPFEHEHTSESVVSSTSYFPAGTGGYANGHFVCLHAHCAEREDQEFMDALNINIMPKAELAVLSEDSPEYHKPTPPPFKRADSGEIFATANNIAMALEAPHICGQLIARDTFFEEIMLKESDEFGALQEGNRRLTDEDYFELRLVLEKKHFFKPIAENTLKAALHAIAKRNAFDSAEVFIRSLEWDGVPRIATFFEKYVKVSDPVFGRAVSEYMFTALAGRALHGGIKADMVPMLLGEQGLLKTGVIEALSPIPDAFVDLDLTADDEKRVRMIKGCLVAEIGEMRGLWGSQIEDIKAFITRRHDKWVPKYKEQAIVYPRRCVFIGTGNHHDILNDSTGSRRFLPLTVVEKAKVEDVARDCLQLWAEAVVLFEQNGIMWQEAQRLAVANNAQYEVTDPWKELISAWLAETDTAGKTTVEALGGGVTTCDVLVRALGHSKGATNSGNGKRVGEIMRSLGFARKRLRLGGMRDYFWVKEEEEE